MTPLARSPSSGLRPRPGRGRDGVRSGRELPRIDSPRRTRRAAAAARVTAAMADHDQPLLERDADADPLVQFQRWFADASAATAIRMPEAMAVASASPDGIPSVRMVLMKG